MLDGLVGRMRIFAEERGGRHELARRADTALEPTVIDERLLERRQPPFLGGEPLDSADLGSVHAERGEKAGGQQHAVHEHAAGATDADRAALFGPGQGEVLAQQVDEEPLGGDRDLASDPVHAETQNVAAHRVNATEKFVVGGSRPTGANSSIYGLGSSIWTKDLAKARRAAEQLEAGYTWVNDIQVAYDQLPFGGAKQSGFGKEHGIEALDSSIEKKSVVIAT